MIPVFNHTVVTERGRRTFLKMVGAVLVSLVLPNVFGGSARAREIEEDSSKNHEGFPTDALLEKSLNHTGQKIPEGKGSYTGDEARAASDRQVVLHFGSGVEEFANAQLKVLHGKGCPAIALPGGPDGLVKTYTGGLESKNLCPGEKPDSAL